MFYPKPKCEYLRDPTVAKSETYLRELHSNVEGALLGERIWLWILRLRRYEWILDDGFWRHFLDLFCVDLDIYIEENVSTVILNWTLYLGN